MVQMTKRVILTTLLSALLLLLAGSAAAEGQTDDWNGDGALTAADAACAMREAASDPRMTGPEILLKSVGLIDRDGSLPVGETPDIISPNHLYRFSYREPVVTETSHSGRRSRPASISATGRPSSRWRKATTRFWRCRVTSIP